MINQIWDVEFETMLRPQMFEIQSQRLRDTVNRVYAHVPSYRAKMDAVGIKPYHIKTIEDLRALPFTTKDDFRENYPYSMFAIPMKEVVRIHASSGTTGKPTVVGYSRKDIETWTSMMARTLTAAGVGEDDFIHVAYGYGLFTGGLGLHYGGEKVGATVIPVSGGNTKRQVQLMRDLGSTVLACTPSYALYLAEAITDSGINPSELKLRVGVFGAEPWSENMRKEIEAKLGIKAFDIYGLSEITGPGVSFECNFQNGLHVNEDHFLPEIIDPQTLEPVTGNQEGELVFTTITKEGLPVIRYRTGDLTTLNREKCQCGRTLVRMKKCKGRTDDMLVIRGVNLFPSHVESVLLEVDETAPHYQLVVDRLNNLDTLELHVELKKELMENSQLDLSGIKRKLEKQLENSTGISIKVTLAATGSIERSEGKAKRVIDKRKIN